MCAAKVQLDYIIDFPKWAMLQFSPNSRSIDSLILPQGMLFIFPCNGILFLPGAPILCSVDMNISRLDGCRLARSDDGAHVFLADAVRQESQIRRLLFAFPGEVPSAA